MGYCDGPCPFRDAQDLSDCGSVSKEWLAGPITLTNTNWRNCVSCMAEFMDVSHKPNIAEFLKLVLGNHELAELVQSMNLVIDAETEIEEQPGTQFSWVNDLFNAVDLMPNIREVRLTYYFPRDSTKGPSESIMISLTKLLSILAAKPKMESIHYTPIFWAVLDRLNVAVLAAHELLLSQWPRYSLDSPFVQLEEKVKSKLVGLRVDIMHCQLICPGLYALRKLELYGPMDWASKKEFSKTQEDISKIVCDLPSLEELEISSLWFKRYPHTLKSLAINIKNVHGYGREGDFDEEERPQSDALALNAIANTDPLCLTLKNPSWRIAKKVWRPLDIKCRRLQRLHVSGASCSWKRGSGGWKFMKILLSVCQDLRFLRVEDCDFLDNIPPSVVEFVVDVHDGQFGKVAASVPPNLEKLTFVVKGPSGSFPIDVCDAVQKILGSCPDLSSLGISFNIPDREPEDEDWYSKEMMKVLGQLPDLWYRTRVGGIDFDLDAVRLDARTNKRLKTEHDVE